MKKKRTLLVVILSVLTAVTVAATASIGGYMWYQQKQQDEMVAIVNSDEVKNLLVERLQTYDAKAFSSKGIIKSYSIKKKTIKYNPMGGIDFTVIINGDSRLYVFYRVEKNQDGTYRLGGGGKSANLVRLFNIRRNDE